MRGAIPVCLSAGSWGHTGPWSPSGSVSRCLYPKLCLSSSAYVCSRGFLPGSNSCHFMRQHEYLIFPFFSPDSFRKGPFGVSSGSWTCGWFYVVMSLTPAQLLTWWSRVSLLVWVVTFDLSDKKDPACSLLRPALLLGSFDHSGYTGCTRVGAARYRHSVS
jgi:hypothetical protein